MTQRHIPFNKQISIPDVKNEHDSNKTISKQSSQVRLPRSDKCHDIKFPVQLAELVRFKQACKQADIIYKRHKGFGQKLSQTKFNTLLLRYSLNNPHKIKWDRPYSGSKHFLTTKPLEREYLDIGGPYGFSTTIAMSDRRVVYCLVLSALEAVERGVSYESILQIK